MHRVYFMKCRDRIKIGTSLDPDDRLRTLQTGSAYPIVLLGTIPGSFKTENAVHRALSPWRLDGEWFSNCPPVRRFIAATLADGSPARAFESVESDLVRSEERAHRREENDGDKRFVRWGDGTLKPVRSPSDLFQLFLSHKLGPRCEAALAAVGGWRALKREHLSQEEERECAFLLLHASTLLDARRQGAAVDRNGIPASAVWASPETRALLAHLS